MISEKDKQTICDIAHKYHVTRILLFGSALSQKDEPRDIGIAVEDVAEKDFYTFYGELLCSLSTSVDVIDLSKRTKFTDLILKEGITLMPVL
jgi:predicted nucleotidyltransferase